MWGEGRGGVGAGGGALEDVTMLSLPSRRSVMMTSSIDSSKLIQDHQRIIRGSSGSDMARGGVRVGWLLGAVGCNDIKTAVGSVLSSSCSSSCTVAEMERLPDGVRRQVERAGCRRDAAAGEGEGGGEGWGGGAGQWRGAGGGRGWSSRS